MFSQKLPIKLPIKFALNQIALNLIGLKTLDIQYISN